MSSRFTSIVPTPPLLVKVSDEIDFRTRASGAEVLEHDTPMKSNGRSAIKISVRFMLFVLVYKRIYTKLQFVSQLFRGVKKKSRSVGLSVLI